MKSGVSGTVNSSCDTWFTGQAAQSNVWFGVLSPLCSELPSTILADSGNGLSAQTDCDTLRFLQPLPSCQIRQGQWIGQAAPNRDSNAQTSLLWSTGSDTCTCHDRHNARRCFDEGPGPLSFVACGDEHARCYVFVTSDNVVSEIDILVFSMSDFNIITVGHTK